MPYVRRHVNVRSFLAVALERVDDQTKIDEAKYEDSGYDYSRS